MPRVRISVTGEQYHVQRVLDGEALSMLVDRAAYFEEEVMKDCVELYDMAHSMPVKFKAGMKVGTVSVMVTVE